MSVTMAEVQTRLEADEPNYTAAAALGEEILAHVEALAEGPDALLAARAVSLASQIGGRRAGEILRKMARHAQPTVRVQVAGGARRLPRDIAAEILTLLASDEDSGVRRATLRSVGVRFANTELPPDLRNRVTSLAASDPAPFVRALAATILVR